MFSSCEGVISYEGHLSTLKIELLKHLAISLSTGRGKWSLFFRKMECLTSEQAHIDWCSWTKDYPGSTAQLWIWVKPGTSSSPVVWAELVLCSAWNRFHVPGRSCMEHIRTCRDLQTGFNLAFVNRPIHPMWLLRQARLGLCFRLRQNRREEICSDKTEESTSFFQKNSRWTQISEENVELPFPPLSSLPAS